MGMPYLHSRGLLSALPDVVKKRLQSSAYTCQRFSQNKLKVSSHACTCRQQAFIHFITASAEEHTPGMDARGAGLTKYTASWPWACFWISCKPIISLEHCRRPSHRRFCNRCHVCTFFLPPQSPCVSKEPLTTNCGGIHPLRSCMESPVEGSNFLGQQRHKESFD